MLNVKDFGIKADGYSCISRQLNKLIEELDEFGGTIFFPKGRYIVSKPIHLNRSNIKFAGEGSNSSVFLSHDCSITYFQCGNEYDQINNISFQDLGFNSFTDRAYGSFIHFNNAAYIKVKDCIFANANIAINLENVFQSEIDRCTIFDINSRTGIGVHIHGHRAHSDHYLNKVFVQIQDRHKCGGIGFKLQNSQGLWMTNCGSYRTIIGFEISASAGMTTEHFFLHQNHADNCEQNGWQLNAHEASVVRRINSLNDWSSSNQNCGWIIQQLEGSISDVMLSMPIAYDNKGPAVYFDGCCDIEISDARMRGNGWHKDVTGELVSTMNSRNVFISGGSFGSSIDNHNHVDYMFDNGHSDNFYVIRNAICLGYSDVVSPGGNCEVFHCVKK